MKTVLVTGAGGYIGSTLVDLLLNDGFKVIGVDRFFFGEDIIADIIENKNFTLLKKDIRDLTVEDFKGVDCVCDLAALSNDPAGELDEEITYAINFRGREHVAKTAKTAKVGRYVLASSCSIYGTGENTLLTEETVPKPISTYAKANLMAEQAVLPLADDNFCVTVLRQATVFGLSRRMRFDLVVNIMTLNAVERGKIFVLGGGKQWRPLVHVKDTSRAFITVLKTEKEKVFKQIFNVGSSELNYQVLGVAYAVKENIPFPIMLDVVPDDADKRDYNVSFDKIQNVLGFKPQFTPEQGVQEIYKALKLGKVLTDERTVTVKWYQSLIKSKDLLDRIMLNDRLF